MLIKPINIYTSSPYFSSRMRVDQKNIRPQRGEIDSINQETDSTPYYYNKKILQLDDIVNNKDRTYDSFTGLRDKNYLLATLDKRIHNSIATKKPLSIAMFDMDNFKSVNELLGYETGDNFIKTVSKSISDVAKQNSLHPYRFGGDEFFLVFDNQTEDEQNHIVDSILENINSNAYIQSEQEQYKTNAGERLLEYYSSTNKIDQIMSLRTKKGILEELKSNFTTPEAQNDEYLNYSLEYVNNQIKDSYSSLLDERIKEEPDSETKEWLINVKQDLDENDTLCNVTEKKLDEYLRSVYDKTHEMYQIKKWLSDFSENNGFSISGSTVTFSPESLQDRTPISLINEAGEVLKEGKRTRKGQRYPKCI